MGIAKPVWYFPSVQTPVPSRRNASLIRGLHYFEAVARHQSVKLAAIELGISQSAVSHQLRDLTQALGEQLLLRSGRGVALTPTGQRLSEELAVSFAGLHASVDEIVGGGRQTLRLAVCSSFAPGWLIGRLNDFVSTYPDIDLQLRLYAEDPALTDQVADVFVTALPVRPGFASVHVLDEMLVAVHAPRQTGHQHRLVTTDLEPGHIGQDWLDYCNRAELRLSDIQRGPWLQCTHYMLAIEMARCGLGVALVPDFLAQRDLEQGNLVYFNKTRIASGRAYHLCFKYSRANERAVLSLTLWIKAQLATTSFVRFAKKRGA